MNAREKENIKIGLNNLPDEERSRIIRLVADIKRCGEVLELLPEAAAEYEASYEEFVRKYNLKLTREDISFAWMSESADIRNSLPGMADRDKALDVVPESYFWYMNFCEDKLKMIDYMIHEGCVPDNEKLRVWRQRQINRCNGDLGGLNKSFIHAVCCFELASGCSVGCPFCGLNAGRLKSLFRYNDENAKLFRGILEAVKDIIGPAAGMGMMYFATEPLDNPDYEKFEEIYYDVFGRIPQITSAASNRNIDRTRALVKELYEKKSFIHRFTVLSREMALDILNSFSSLELLRVELLPQYDEAPAFVGYTKAGRELEAGHKSKETDEGTIVCIDGFCINFCDKTIEMFTPCRVSKLNPKGIACQEKVTFSTADDFRDKLNGLIDKYVINDISDDQILKLYSYYELREDSLYSKYGGETLDFHKYPEYVRDTVALINNASYNKIELVKKLTREKGYTAENIFFVINQLWKQGFIKEEVFSTDEEEYIL